MKKQRLLAAFLAVSMAVSASFSQNPWTSTAVNFPPSRLGWYSYPLGDNHCWAYSVEVDQNFQPNLNTLRFNRTTDGGLTWTDEPLPFAPLTWQGNFSVIDAQNVWVCGHGETVGSQIFKSTDGGQTWQSKGTAGITVWIDGLHFFDQNEGFAFGDPTPDSKFEVTRTIDGGQTWAPIANLPIAIDLQEVAYTAATDANGDHVIFPTAFDRVAVTHDRGLNWEMYPRPNGTGFIWEQIVGDDGTVWVTMSDFQTVGTVFRRGPSDANWTNAHEASDEFFYGLEQPPGTKTLIGIARNLPAQDLWRTRISYDQGATWTTVHEDGVPLGFPRFSSASTGYCSSRGINSDNGSTQIFRYTGSPLTGLLEAKPLDLEVAAFPNPTADWIEIQFEKGQNQAFWLLLNDASGRLVARKTLENGQPGRAVFDLKNEPPGVYRLTVASEKGMATRSVVKN